MTLSKIAMACILSSHLATSWLAANDSAVAIER